MEQINKAPTVVFNISDIHGKKLRQSEALLDTGVDTHIDNKRFLRRVGQIDSYIWYHFLYTCTNLIKQEIEIHPLAQSIYARYY